jgi:hypothetical protein
MIFSNVKQGLQSLACRTRENLRDATQLVMDMITFEDARS